MATALGHQGHDECNPAAGKIVSLLKTRQWGDRKGTGMMEQMDGNIRWTARG